MSTTAAAAPPLTPARKGDVVAYSFKRGYTAQPGSGVKSVSYVVWRVGIVASATRDGRVKSIIQLGYSTRLDNVHQGQHRILAVEVAPKDKLDVTAIVQDPAFEHDFRSIDEATSAVWAHEVST